MNSSQVRRFLATALSLMALTLVGGAPGAAASSGSITNVHAVGDQIVATYTTNFDLCTGSYCGWYPLAFQFRGYLHCVPGNSNIVYAGDFHPFSGSETTTEKFYPAFPGPIKICLYAAHDEHEYLIAHTTFTPRSRPAHISFDRACYREGDPVRLTGRGFASGSALDIAIGGAADRSAVANSHGRFATSFTAPSITILSPPPPMTRRYGVAVTESEPGPSGVYSGSAPLRVATLGVATSPSLPAYGDIPRRVSFVLSGFDSGRKVYAHWRHRGNSAGIQSLGRAHGPCGELRSPRMPFRERIDGRGGWTIQFDQRRSYVPLREPEAHLSFTVFTTYARMLVR